MRISQNGTNSNADLVGFRNEGDALGFCDERDYGVAAQRKPRRLWRSSGAAEARFAARAVTASLASEPPR
jgi:hypothetical protein